MIWQKTVHSLSTPDTHRWAACLELKQQLLSRYITAETAIARVEVVKKNPTTTKRDSSSGSFNYYNMAQSGFLKIKPFFVSSIIPALHFIFPRQSPWTFWQRLPEVIWSNSHSKANSVLWSCLSCYHGLQSAKNLTCWVLILSQLRLSTCWGWCWLLPCCTIFVLVSPEPHLAPVQHTLSNSNVILSDCQRSG